MTEYISKDKFIHFLFKKIAHIKEAGTDTEIHVSDVLCSVVNEIWKFPAEEVRPVVHGKWLKDYKMPTCSVCGNAVPFPDQYCSNCGSKMDLDIADYVAERGRENG